MNTNNKAFLSNVAIVSLGPILSSVLGFIVEPWISRLWDPGVYGIGAYYVSMVYIASPLLFLRYNFAIVQAQDQVEMHSLFVLSIAVMIILMIAFLPVYFLYDRILTSNEFSFEKYGIYLLTTISFASYTALLRFWYSAKKRFIAISGSVVITSLSNTILLLIFGVLGLTSESTVIFIRSFSIVIVPIVLFIPYFKNDFRTTVKIVTVKSIFKVAKEYRKYPLYEIWGFAASTMSFHIPAILIARFWTIELVGLYSKAYHILFVIVNILGDAVNKVLHKEAADRVNSKTKIDKFIQKTTLSSVKFALLPTVILIILSPELFRILLGNKWTFSGVLAQYMAFWMFAAVLANILDPLFGVLNKQGQYTIFTISTLVVRFGVLVYMGINHIDIRIAIGVFCLANFVILSAKSIYILEISGVKIGEFFSILAKPAIQIIPLLIVLLILKHMCIQNELLLVIIAGVLSLPYVYLFYIKNSGFIRVSLGLAGRLLWISR